MTGSTTILGNLHIGDFLRVFQMASACWSMVFTYVNISKSRDFFVQPRCLEFISSGSWIWESNMPIGIPELWSFVFVWCFKRFQALSTDKPSKVLEKCHARSCQGQKSNEGVLCPPKSFQNWSRSNAISVLRIPVAGTQEAQKSLATLSVPKCIWALWRAVDDDVACDVHALVMCTAFAREMRVSLYNLHNMDG